MKSKKLTVKNLMAMCGMGVGGLMAAHASASVTYSYVAIPAGNSTPSTSIMLQVGGPSQTIAIYLQESLSGNSPSLISADGGLYSGGFSISLIGAPANPSLLSSATGFAANFTGGNSAEAGSGDSPSLRRIDNTVSNQVSAAGTGGPIPSNGLIEIGTVTLAPATTAGVSQFTLWDYEMTAAANKLVGGYTQTNGVSDFNLDKTITTGPNQYSGAGANPTTLTVTTTAVPEPASLALLMSGCLGLLARRRRIA